MSILLLPIRSLFRLVTFIIQTMGRLLAVILGGALMLVGVLLSLTIVGVIIGVPLALFGFALTLRGLF